MSQNTHKRQPARVIPFILACTISIGNIPLAIAAPGDTNSMNTGTNPTAGTYYNTTGSQTSFVNNTGLNFQGNYRFLNTNGADGGNAFIQAPYVGLNSAILDASAPRDASGNFLGNGGSITINARMLYANNADLLVAGKNGGSVSMSTGSMFARNVKIDARGTDGVGGSIRVDAQNIVDIDKNSLFDASGKVIGSFDNSLIDIKGAVVNMDGILKANGFDSQGGTIHLTAAGTTDDCINCDADAAARLGIITDAQANDVKVTFNSLKSNGGDVLIGSNAVIEANGASDRAVTMDTGYEYNYARAGGGGTITVNAQDDIINKGDLSARGGQGKLDGVMLNGGHGGTISFVAGDSFSNEGVADASGGHGIDTVFTITDPTTGVKTVPINPLTGKPFPVGGYGGNGGVIAVSAQRADNKGALLATGGDAGTGSPAYAEVSDSQINSNGYANADARAARGSNGGNGGLIVFNGPANPTNTGLIDVSGGNAGNGGDAIALATARSQFGPAYANAYAKAGESGYAGYGGTIVVKNPSAGIGGNVNVAGGAAGRAGTAKAEADAASIYGANSSAEAIGNASSIERILINGVATNGVAQQYAPRANGANGGYSQLQNTEAIAHNGSIILLNNTAAAGNTVSGLASIANVRDIHHQAGGGVLPAGYKNLVVADTSGRDLTIGTGELAGRYNSVTINQKGNLSNMDNVVARNASIIAGGDVNNIGSITTAESVLLSAGGNMNNIGNITSSNANQGGSVLIHVGGKLRNSGQISAGHRSYGGAVHIKADELENAAGGRIAAASYSQYDTGVPGALAANANGGLINVIARKVTNNGTITVDQVDNLGRGGIMMIQAKESFNNTSTISSNGAVGGKVVIGVRSVNPGQLLNTGVIQANQGGSVILADGIAQVNQLICLDPPPPPPPKEPPVVTPPDQEIGVFLPSTGPIDVAARLSVPPNVEVADGNLFLARGFEGMTRQILDQTYVTYQSAMERGNGSMVANQQAIEYLMEAGMTSCVARELANRMDKGEMVLSSAGENGKIREILEVIANVAVPEDGGQLLIQ